MFLLHPRIEGVNTNPESLKCASIFYVNIGWISAVSISCRRTTPVTIHSLDIKNQIIMPSLTVAPLMVMIFTSMAQAEIEFVTRIYDKYGFTVNNTQQISNSNLTLLVNQVLDGRFYNNDASICENNSCQDQEVSDRCLTLLGGPRYGRSGAGTNFYSPLFHELQIICSQPYLLYFSLKFS